MQPGETLSDIADGVGVDSATLAALNAIDDVNLVAVGQSIKLPANSAAPAPAPSASPRTYTVAAGDTLWHVAQQFATTTAALVDANHLDDPDHLVAGTQLALPSGVSAAPASQAPAPAAPQTPPAAAKTTASPKRSLLVPYTVQAGETLGQIAQQFDATADAIAQASGLDDPNRLSIGTVLKVPLPGREHVVQAGRDLARHRRPGKGRPRLAHRLQRAGRPGADPYRPGGAGAGGAQRADRGVKQPAGREASAGARACCGRPGRPVGCHAA